MKIGDVLKKVAAGEELGDEEKAFLEGYEEPNLEAAANAKGKKERLKLEAKIAELQEAKQDLQESLEASTSDGSEIEKLQKQFEKMNEKFESTQKALATEKEAHANTQRSNALKSVDVPWLPSVPQGYKDTVLGDAFADIDTDDLGNADVVKPIVASIVESQANFITASTPSGTGTPPKEGGKVADSKITIDNLGELKGKALIENMDEAFAVANEASN